MQQILCIQLVHLYTPDPVIPAISESNHTLCTVHFFFLILTTYRTSGGCTPCTSNHNTSRAYTEAVYVKYNYNYVILPQDRHPTQAINTQLIRQRLKILPVAFVSTVLKPKDQPSTSAC